MPIRRQDGKQKRIDSWEGHVEQMIREAQERGEFDDLPGAGKPLDLTDNPFAGEWQSAFRTARNAGALPCGWSWTGRSPPSGSSCRRWASAARGTCRRSGPAWSLTASGRAGAGRARRGNAGGGASSTAPGGRCGRRSARPRSLEELEAERERARRIYLKRAGAIDEKIRDFNTHRPRNLSWLEKPRLPPEVAGQDFDRLCPPFTEPG